MDLAATAPKPPSRWRRRLLLLLVMILVVYAVASWVTASILLHPPRRPVLTGPESGERFENLRLTTSDGLSLAASILEPPAPEPGAVLLFHGLGGCRQTWRMKALRDAGFRSLAVDLRAHGESGGEVTSFGYHERHDVLVALDFARQRWPGTPLAAWGTSLGGAALLYAAEAVRPLPAIILESVYTTIESAYDHRLALFVPRVLRWTGLGPRLCTQAQLGLGLDDLRPIDHIAILEPATVMVVTGAEDRRATPDDARELAARIPGAGLHLVPGAGHDDVWTAGGAAYREKVIAFLRARLAR